MVFDPRVFVSRLTAFAFHLCASSTTKKRIDFKRSCASARYLPDAPLRVSALKACYGRSRARPPAASASGIRHSSRDSGRPRSVCRPRAPCKFAPRTVSGTTSRGGKLPDSESLLNPRRSHVDDDGSRGDGGSFRDQAGEIRALHPSRSDRRGRDGGGVPGGDARRGGVPADVRRQANPGRAGAVAVLRRHVRAGGAHQRAPAPPEHRAGVRLRQRRRHLLPGDGVRARARRLGDPAAAARARAPLPGGRGGVHRARGGGGAGLRAHAGRPGRHAVQHRPPRHQPVQHHVPAGGRGEAARLRDRQGARRARGREDRARRSSRGSSRTSRRSGSRTCPSTAARICSRSAPSSGSCWRGGSCFGGRATSRR